MVHRNADLFHSQIEFGKAGMGSGTAEMEHILREGEVSPSFRVLAKITLPPGGRANLHRHTGESELYYYLKGEGVYNDNGTEYTVRAGDVTVVPDGQSHGLFNNGSEALEYIAVVFYTP